MLYYFVIFVDNTKDHEEFFECGDLDLAKKYISYKEQSTREIINFNKSENDLSIIKSTYYSPDSVKTITSESVESLETILHYISKFRGLLLEAFHKLKNHI